MKLNKQQIEYAFDRIKDIVQARVDKKVGPAPVAKFPKMSFEEQLAAIRSNDPKKAKLLPDKQLNRYTNIQDAYEYPAYAKAMADAEKPVAEWRKNHAIALRDEGKKARRIQDRIMLSGDAEAAIALLDKYAAGAEP